MLISTAFNAGPGPSQVPRHLDQLAPGFAYPLKLPRIANQARQCASICICSVFNVPSRRLGSYNPLFLSYVLPSLLIYPADCKGDQFVAFFLSLPALGNVKKT
jgi:hypothetical protein